MDTNDRRAIESLFQKLADVERDAPPRDAEAESFIHNQIAHQPGAPYYMAQTIVVQEQALTAAQARIEELENAAPQSSGGLLGSLFGGGSGAGARGSVPRTGRAPAGGSSAWGQASGGGGFLAGAAQTAMGVAGGVLLGNAIGGLFGADEAQAGENADSNANDDAADTDLGGDDGGEF